MQVTEDFSSISVRISHWEAEEIFEIFKMGVVALQVDSTAAKFLAHSLQLDWSLQLYHKKYHFLTWFNLLT